jgi:hypothetical protein
MGRLPAAQHALQLPTGLDRKLRAVKHCGETGAQTPGAREWSMEEYLPLIIQAVAGAVGGNVIGALRRNNSFGPLINSLLGAVGGVGAAQGLQAGGFMAQMTDILGGNPNVASGAGGLAGGLLLPLIASFFKRGS